MSLSQNEARIPWWGRFETRVIATLILLGVVSVGASTYLVQLTVSYFQGRLGSALEEGQRSVDTATGFYQAFVEAEVAAFEARSDAMVFRLAAHREDPGWDEKRALQDLVVGVPDVVRVSLVRAEGHETTVLGSETMKAGDTYAVTRVLPVGTYSEEESLEIVFLINAELADHYRWLGERKRSLSRQRDQQTELEQVVYRAVGIASGLVLVISLVVGWLVARPMARKVSKISAVMRRVGSGDLAARTDFLGRDELGQLASAFNRMLEELAAAQHKLTYLQRIGAWQEMARRIAHEIKNPLTPIQLAIEQLRDKDPGNDPEFSRLIRVSAEIVEDEIQTLRRMVATFSQFARVPEVHVEVVAVERVLDEFERAYGHLTDRPDDQLVIVPPPSDLEVLADRQLLKQCLVNLVENAVLSAREARVDAVRVEISVEESGESVVLYVDDNGEGILSARRERVFEPYETGRKQGTGLGLTIVKKVILDHGGEIFIEDSPLGGARFVIRLRKAAGPPSLAPRTIE